jgi:hypothetical protein
MANPFDQFDEQKNPFDQFASPQNLSAEHRDSFRAKPVQKSGGVADLIGGIGGGIADLLRGIQQRAVEAGTAMGAVPPFVKSRLYEEEAKRRENREFNPDVTQAEKIGRGIGMIGGTAPLAFLPSGQTAVGSTLASILSGGAAGAMLPTTSGTEALLNAGMAASGQAGGNFAARAVLPTTARGLSQAQKDIIDAATAEQIPLRTSEATGSNVIKNWEQMRANRPITGGMEQRFNTRQTEAINRAFTRRLGNEMNEVNDASLREFQKKIGGDIGNMVKGKNVPLDTDFFNAVVAVDIDSKIGGNLTSTPALSKTIDDAIDLIANKPAVKGETAQRIRSKLMDRARDARAAENTELANGLEDLVDGLKKSIEGTMTGAERDAWKVANRRYANYKLVEEAFIKDPRSLALGDVPINKMARVMEQSRPRSYVHGTGDFANLAKLGQVIKPPGRSALLGESSLPIARNAMDLVHGAAYPILESQMMQRYLTGGMPLQRTLRDMPGAALTSDAAFRLGGMGLLMDDELFR